MKTSFNIFSISVVYLGILVFTSNLQAARFVGTHHRDWQDWSFDYQVSGDHDGVSLTKVKYKDVPIFSKASLPVMRVFYDNNVCGPYVDRMGGDLTPISWANNDLLVLREFTQSGRQWLEIGIQDTIGDYVIYQAWYLSADGILDGHIFSKGLQCNIDHVHYPYWRMDFDLAGEQNDQIRRFVNGDWQTASTEFDDNVTTASNHRWQVRDTVTGDSVDIEFGSAGWNDIDGTVNPVNSFDNNVIFGRSYKQSEDGGWVYGAHSEVPHDNNENIDGQDILLWYKGYLPHDASEGPDLWHSTGVRFVVNLAASNPPPSGNNDPTISAVDNQTNQVGDSVSLQIDANDSNGDTLTYSATGLPSGFSIDENTGLITGTPLNNGEETTVNISVDDGNNGTAQITFTWTIATITNPSNNAPTINSVANQTNQVGDSISLQIDANDSDGDTLSYSASGLPSGLNINSNTGVISGELTTVGVSTANIAVDDGNGGSAQVTFTWTIGATTESPAESETTSFDFESDQGWITNPAGNNTATTGKWQRSNPSSTFYRGSKMQPEDAAEGQFALITDGRPGSYAGSNDVDNGVTTIRSPNIDLTNATQINLSFSYFFAHLANSNNRDHLQVRVIGTTRSTVFKKSGRNRIVEAEWKTRTIDISQFAGQTIYLLIQAADRGSPSLVEAGIDNVSVSLQ